MHLLLGANMSIKIYKFNKSDLSTVSEIDASAVGLSNTVSMTISHYADSYKSTEATIPFQIEGSNKHVPIIDEVEHYLVSRNEVDLTATGPNTNIIGDANKDIGKYEFKEIMPRELLDLPPGFIELYRREE